jgi:hypothetical protein
MWRDLDAAAWPKGSDILEHELVRKLFGEDVRTDSEPPIVSEEESIDQHIDIASSVHVVDADSSQALCIKEARQCRNLVIQGPPGTGKSQTITNIIAASVREGKSVLFVAEKAAALDVVYGRLKTVGLEPLCLEIYSKKATKAAVISSLDRSIRAGGVTQTNSRNATELRAARDRLNDWSDILHCEIGSSGRTPYQVMGTILKLRGDGVPVFGRRLDVAGNWDRDQLGAVTQAVGRASTAVEKLVVSPISHPWYGTFGNRLTPMDAERLKEALTTSRKVALNQHGLEEIATGLTNGSVQSGEAGPMTDLLIAEALWARACADDPVLNTIDGSERSRIVSDFRTLDRKRIELARSEVLASYFERRPTGNVGEMGVIHGEIGK